MPFAVSISTTTARRCDNQYKSKNYAQFSNFDKDYYDWKLFKAENFRGQLCVS